MSSEMSQPCDQVPAFRPSWGPGMAALWALLIGLSLLPVAAMLAILGLDFPTLPDGSPNFLRMQEIGDPIAIALCLIVASRLRSNPIDVLALRFPKRAVRVLKIIGLTVLATCIISIAVAVAFDGEEDPNQKLNTLMLGKSGLWEGLISTGLLVPIKEEMLFRGLLLLAFFNTRFWFWSAAVLTSALFALAHNPMSINLLFHAPYFLMGLAFAAALRYSGSLWVPIGLHALKNSIAVLLLAFG
jgi:membrane protease YdiL (CAAX protease family)